VAEAKTPIGTQDRKSVGIGKIQEYDWNTCEKQMIEKQRNFVRRGVWFCIEKHRKPIQ
jgi:hypothetical protein